MRYPLVSRVESLDLKYSRIEKTSRVFRDRELLLLPLSISPVFLSLSLSASLLAHSGTWPRWCFPMALLAVSVYV